MSAVLDAPEVGSDVTVADLLDRFGPIPHRRIRQNPAPGTATEDDVLALHDRENRLYELVDGILVEKDVGLYESLVAVRLTQLLCEFLRGKRLGQVFGADGFMKLRHGLVRIPDVSFVSRQRLSKARIRPHGPLVRLVPEIAAEVISRGNTQQEMDQKLNEYFDAGVKLVWMIHPVRQEVKNYQSPKRSRTIKHPQRLDGGDVLPGLEISLAELFAPVDDD
jgi:Uma2 family endonuclease